MVVPRRALLVIVAAAAACKDPAPAPAGTATPPPPPREITAVPVTPTPLVGDELAAAYVDGWTAWSHGDRAGFARRYAADVVGHAATGADDERRGRDAVVAAAWALRADVPDAVAEPMLVLVNQRTVAAIVRVVGTAPPAGPGAPATATPLGVLWFHQATFDDANQIADEWSLLDHATVRGQLGQAPGPVRPALPAVPATTTVEVSAASGLERANLATVEQAAAGFARRDVAAATAALTEHTTDSDQTLPADLGGVAAIAPGLRGLFARHPDLIRAPLTLWGAGDFVVSLARLTVGPATVTVAEIALFQRGQIRRRWRFYDRAGLATPLFAPPARGRPARAR
ncbi:MAG: nuclear transport factor 2 family protein [Kofleriaceae bacterium]